MASIFTVSIPVSPYIKKFVATRYGQPLRLDNSTLLGTIIVSVVSRLKFDVSTPLSDMNIQYRHYTAKLQCVAPMSELYQLGNGVGVNHAIQINRHLEKDFEERLNIFVSQHITKGKRRCGYKEAIEKFAAFYNIVIDEDISLEGLVKIHYRYRKKQEKKLAESLTGLSAKNAQIPLVLL